MVFSARTQNIFRVGRGGQGGFPEVHENLQQEIRDVVMFVWIFVASADGGSVALNKCGCDQKRKEDTGYKLQTPDYCN